MAATGKRATIHDVARLAGVSIKTVSRVYNDEPNVREAIREKVREVGQELRYRPNAAARNLVERRSHLIGLFFENPSSSYVTELQMGALERLRGTRYRLLIFPVENRADIRGALIETAHASGLDGIIVTPPMSDDPEILQELSASAMPFARVAGDVNVHPTDSVSIDDEAATVDLMEYLLKLGHRKIAIIIGDPTHRSAELRLAGYRRALEAAGIERNPDYEAQGGFSFASGLVAGKKLLSLENRPTAIFASNDDMAAAVVQMAHDHKLSVPGDLTVVGFDDSSIASMVSPQITTVRQPIFEMTRGAADMLLNHIENGQTSPARKIDYKLIIRQSAGKAPA
ncbi:MULTISPECIES: LacI family DNA-binding transcriptional regulator [unclassified Ochrobactrum]|jgi:LacI family transcriptional regulator|uniref:LacI family DNA-binding transcriptional regulator n=1 Tax=Brucella/Ochrobactrum group TaxID=2826938 RepID=UPI00124E0708|nr:LacI family transcriptional regulator [Ochrobactrum sp. Kaboul]MBA8837248.1 LacI family transcriptional regulator [Ochrobactrum sp. RH2CCR150]MDH7784532.1 LacI family transcriptional regulator [Ochrobactrum sp. 19YEA23]